MLHSVVTDPSTKTRPLLSAGWLGGVGPPPRPQPLLNMDEAISEVWQELDEMRLTQQEINEEGKRLLR